MRGESILLSNLRGSLGGLTASRNRYGSYLRERVTPIQPNTPAQLGAKTAFGASAPVFRGLTATQKQFWNNFARDTFQPRNKTNVGLYSGQVAFNAIWTQWLNSQRINRLFTVSKDGVLLPGGITTTPYESPLIASPSGLIVPSFIDDSGQPQSGAISDANLDQSGICDFTLEMGNGSGYDFGKLHGFGVGDTGFAIYCSSANPVEGMAFRNKEKYLLGYLDSCAFTVPADGANAGNFTMDCTSPLNVLDYQGFPIGGQWVNLSVYIVSHTCAMKLIGRFETEVTASP